jgi:hypothetical protein
LPKRLNRLNRAAAGSCSRCRAEPVIPADRCAASRAGLRHRPTGQIGAPSTCSTCFSGTAHDTPPELISHVDLNDNIQGFAALEVINSQNVKKVNAFFCIRMQKLV